MKNNIVHNKILSAILVLCLVTSSLTGCGIGSQHLEVKYEENENENIINWNHINESITTWDDADIVSWNDVDEYADWVYSELLFADILEDMPIVECRVLNYQSNGKYFDGEKVYQMVGDKFDINSFAAKYAVGTGVIIICVVLNVVTSGVSTPITCFIAGAADASVAMAAKGAAFGAATKAVVSAIKSGGDIEETLYGALEGSADGYMWGAIFGAATGGFKSSYCFTEDTLVMTSLGKQKISEIEVGDAVYAYDEITGQYAYKQVTQVNFGETLEILRIHIDNEIIECTPNHPFLTDSGWVSAYDLKEGNLLLSVNNVYRAITEVEMVSYESPIPIITLCVNEYHSFLVGNYGVVAHNRCKPNEQYADKTKMFDEGTAQATKYPNGVPFDKDGFPIFDQYAVKTVKFDFPSPEGKAAGKCLTGNCNKDFALANKKAGLQTTPQGYTWHHCQDMMTMQLLPQDLHSVVYGGIAHKGGASLLQEFWETLVPSVVIP